MHVVKISVIHSFCASASPAAAADAKNWLAVSRAANWASPQDVSTAFPNAKRANNHWTFPLQPSGATIEAVIRFQNPTGVVVVQQAY